MIPAYHTDYIFAVICEEFGIVFGVGVIALYLLIVVARSFNCTPCGRPVQHARSIWSNSNAGGANIRDYRRRNQTVPLTGITMPQ